MLRPPQPADDVEVLRMLATFYDNSERFVLASVSYRWAQKLWQRPFKFRRDFKPVTLLTLLLIQSLILLVLALLLRQVEPLVIAQVIGIVLMNTAWLFAIHEEYHILIPGIQHLVLTMTKDDPGRAHMHRYLRRTFDLKRQFLWALAIASLSITATFTLNLIQNIDFAVIVYISLFSMYFCLGHLIYWPFACAEFLIFLSHCELRIYSLAPAEDEHILLISRLINVLALYAGPYYILFLVISFIVLVAPFQDISFSGFVFLWYVFTICLLLFWFISTNYLLTRIISNEKHKVLTTLRSKLDNLYESLDDLDPDLLTKIEKGQKLYEQIKSSSSTSINVNLIRSGLAAVGIQSLPLLAAIDWGYLMDALGRMALGLPIP